MCLSLVIYNTCEIVSFQDPQSVCNNHTSPPLMQTLLLMNALPLILSHGVTPLPVHPQCGVLFVQFNKTLE